MSLLGIDVGTTGCKAALFSETGRMLAAAYEEYDFVRPEPGWAELDAVDVWAKIRRVIKKAVSEAAGSSPVRALAVSSLAEAMVPVSADRHILGPSILNFDRRGAEYLAGLRSVLPDDRLYAINGNTLGNHYSLTKLKWIKQYQLDLYERTYKFLLWGSFVAFMLGAEPVVDYSLANRSLLFDIHRETWSEEILTLAQLDREKLPDVAPSETVIGVVSRRMAAELGLPASVAIVAGAHDQCANAVGCGVVEDGRAAYGMGTFLCATPVFSQPPTPAVMIERGLNTEHHAIPGTYATFIYNQGGSLVKWFRNTFAATEWHAASIRLAPGERKNDSNIYPDLFAEIPPESGGVIVLPHFAPTGPPHFIADSAGVITGLRLETTRGEILRGIVEGATFYLKACLETLPAAGIEINHFYAAGGGSRSDAWVQMSADILGRPFTRPLINEAGALGAAIIAGIGSGLFSSYAAGVKAMVKMERTFEPDRVQQKRYAGRFEKYQELWLLMQAYLTGRPS
jgi:xylulokinase